MPTSALLITLDKSHRHYAAALVELAAEPDLHLGASQGDRIPAVLDAPSLEASHATVERLQRKPGVLFVDLLSVNFEDANDM
jgi:hypothetical protein